MLAKLRTTRRLGETLLVLSALLALVASSLPATAAPPPAKTPEPSIQGELGARTDRDARPGRVRASARQTKLATGAKVRWNAFGTPGSMFKPKGWLATGLPANDGVAARTWVKRNRELFRLSAKGVDALEVVTKTRVGTGSAVTFSQRFGDLPAANDGLLTVAVTGGKIAYASSSVAGDGNAPAAASVAAQDAWRAAAADLGRQVASADIAVKGTDQGWTTLSAKGFASVQRARLRALPTPTQGVRPAWETIVFDNAALGDPLAFTSYVDARTGDVLLRKNLVDHVTDDPQSTNTTSGNAARSVENWNSADPFTVGANTATARPDRKYTYAWTDQWDRERCNPDTFTSPQRNDIDASLVNLFAMHNRMHDFAYFLGFTEQTFNLQRSNFGLGGLGGDPEQGNAQAGGLVGGPPGFLARDNANQITPPDGMAPITNMYLWQPIAAAFYSPCVDGDFDMTVIGHEYTHAISNRMVAGPDNGLQGAQAGAMGEAWSDLVAMEYLNENGYVPINGESPWAVGPYVTGDKKAGIRNWALDRKPVNYSDVGYDVTGPQVHADGEIWAGVNFAIRQVLVARYNKSFPARNRALQQACADGRRPADRCPGNRRWIQTLMDAFLLMPSQVSMLDARDAYLAADQLRFGGANQVLLWDVFARHGMGTDASTTGTADGQPVPGFSSPFAPEGQVAFRPVDERGGPVAGAQLFVGPFEARVTPVADTDAATSLSSSVVMVPGTYEFVVRANGFGHKRLKVKVIANRVSDVRVVLPANLASSTNGATVGGDGVNQTSLIDDTEATNWASLGAPVPGRSVSVHLDPAKPWHRIGRVQVSALNRPLDPTNTADPGGQNRFTALRQFQLQTCVVTATVDCLDASDFTVAYTSPADAFPAVRPRPRAPELQLRSFKIPSAEATYVRFVVLNSQCTGAPDYQGEQDNDPRAATDCDTASLQGLNVRASELQVFQE